MNKIKILSLSVCLMSAMSFLAVDAWSVFDHGSKLPQKSCHSTGKYFDDPVRRPATTVQNANSGNRNGAQSRRAGSQNKRQPR